MKLFKKNTNNKEEIIIDKMEILSIKAIMDYHYDLYKLIGKEELFQIRLINNFYPYMLNKGITVEEISDYEKKHYGEAIWDGEI